jgi:sigma-B regulation protein RsbU (phosphoserine phosphatase)
MDASPAATFPVDADFVDLSSSLNIDLYIDMVQRISLAKEPHQVMDAFSNGMRKARGESGLVTISCKGLKPGQYKITRRIGYDGVNHAETNDPWNQRGKLPTRTGGFIGKLISSPQPKLVHALRITDDPVLGDWLSQFGCAMAIPAFTDGVALNWAIILKREPRAYSINDLEEHILRANLIGATVNNTVMNNQLREVNARMAREVERIAAIQKALLPRVLPVIRGMKIAASYETYDVAGGDMYDFVCMIDGGKHGKIDPDARWAFMIADVSGHGPGAAVLAAMLNAILYAYPTSPERPSEMLNYANRHLCDKRIEHSFVTALFCIYNPLTRKFMFSRAGHPPAIVKTPGKPLVHLDKGGGLPLGVLEDVVYQDEEVTLEPGQTVVLYTDGISESQNPRREMFGIRGIETALDHCTGEPDCVINSITKALREHEAGAQPGDDQTIVALKVVQDLVTFEV